MAWMIPALVLMSFNVQAQGQGVCGTDEHYSACSNANPAMIDVQHQMDSYVDHLRKAQGKTAVKDVGQEIIVPIVFHIIHNNGPENISDQVVKDEVARLNIDYNKQNSDTAKVRAMFKPLIANPHFTFVLAKLDPYGRCTNGIDRVVSPLTDSAGENTKLLDCWDTKHYLNVWVVKSISSSGLPPGEVLAGYAEFPWSATYDPGHDGVEIGYNFVGKNQRVLTHEIGHYFGLYHPFQDGCSNDQNLEGDHVADTPPVLVANINSKVGINSCHTDNPDLPDLVEDYMDYYPFPSMFTIDQAWRLRAFAFERSELISQGNRDTVLGGYCATLSGVNQDITDVQTASVFLFPNPANNTVTIKTESGSEQTGSISLIDMTGKTIFIQDHIAIGVGTQEISLTKNQLHVNNNGIYFFRIMIGNNITQSKIVFQN